MRGSGETRVIDPYRLVRPILAALPPETAHRAAILALKSGLVEAAEATGDPILASRVFGREFPNPIGLAAGFDKDAEVPDAALRLGFGFAEAGTVTPRPQPGNPRPRLFRLACDRAVINRLGFNNRGLDAFARRLARRARRGIVGANVGRNKDSADATADYVAGVTRLAPLADYLVMNISSPNTPGLRALQRRGAMAELIAAAMVARDQAMPVAPPPLLVKIAPDLAPDEREDIAEVALAAGLDGLIVGNTTVTRPPGLNDARRVETGGLSGRPLKPLAHTVLADMYRLTGGRIVLIGCGGIESGADALALIRAGASLVQLYTALVFDGPGLIRKLQRELAAALRAGGFASVAEAVGADRRGGA